MNNLHNFKINTKKAILITFFTGVPVVSWSADISKDTNSSKNTEHEESMLVTAETMIKQQPGVSVITSDDIMKNPPINDLSDIIRKMPGINLTGNSNTGARGNNRQIDIRGMGPENTLILIDGNPVTSRNAIRYAWDGERDTRGDTNWVPAEEVDHIDVIRGPAAARYGAGAAGGVINIITKRPTSEWHGSLSYFLNQPENSKEGNTNRTNFSLSGPLNGDILTMRVYGNWNKTKSDSPGINGVDANSGLTPAGREGVRNQDINAVMSWKPVENQIIDFEAGFNRQGNIYAGDTQFSMASDKTAALARSGAETNKLYRQNYAITHNGIWNWGLSKLSFQYDQTRNSRLDEGLTGRAEGTIKDNAGYTNSILKNFRTNGEINFPIEFLVDQTITLGGELSRAELVAPNTVYETVSTGDTLPGLSSLGKNSKSHQDLVGIYFEDNIQATKTTQLIPGLRFDRSNQFGGNFSPSLNISQDLGDLFKLKAGIARAFKSPNLYQSNPNYLLQSRGNGCPLTMSWTPCYLMGNTNLKPEISINKEIGIEFSDKGWIAGVTWFRNDYKNKIIAGTDVLGTTNSGTAILQWQNTGKAVVEGLEGNLTVPLSDRLNFTTNATYMIQSEDKTTKNPLSIIPKYTINSSFDWKINDILSANINYTLYGPQKPKKYAINQTEKMRGLNTTQVGSYGLVGLGIQYELSKNLDLKVGINNLFDKDIKRKSLGASTYNEPGRAYYMGITASF